MRRALGPSAIVLGVMLLGGCATGHGGSFADGFVTQGQPTVDIGGPPVTSEKAPPSDSESKPPAETVPRHASYGATLETSDPALSEALLVESAAATAESHLRVAEEYRRHGVLDAAHARLLLALRKEPRMVAAHDALARLWRDWGFPHEALGAAHRAWYFSGGSATALNTLGTVLDALGRLDEARDAYQGALFSDPAAHWVLSNLCYLEFRFGRPEDARLHCEAALRLDPKSSAARNNLALTYAATGDLVRAHKEFSAAGNAAAAAYNLGLMYLAAKEYPAAAEAFEQAIRARPNFSAAKSRARIARLRILTGSN